MATSRAKSRRFNINGPRTATRARGAFSTFARRVHLGTNPVAAHPRVSRPIDPDRRVGATRHSDPAGPNAVHPAISTSTSTSTSTDDDPSIDRVRRDRPDADRRVDRPNVVDRPVDRLADRDAARPPSEATVPVRRTPSSRSANRASNSSRNSRTRFQPTYCFPVTCSARRDSLSADVSSTALTGHACDVFDTRGFAGLRALPSRREVSRGIPIWRRRLARRRRRPLPRVPPPPRPTI